MHINTPEYPHAFMNCIRVTRNKMWTTKDGKEQKCKEISVEGATETPLSLSQLQLAFWLLLVGNGIGGCAFLAEAWS